MSDLTERLRKDLEPYRGKTVGSLRIDMGEVQKILATADKLEALQAEISAHEHTIENQWKEIARLRDALSTLKGHCNRHIKSINHGAGARTAGFAQINMLLKQCDEAFKALDDKAMSDLIERLECFNWSCPNAEKIAKEAASEIARLRKSLEMADLSCDMKEARLGLKEQEIARLRAERFEPLGDNHHNAAKCPHCNPEYEAQQAEIERLIGDQRMP